ncbi:SAV_2336 N-terminal domain-related protein [Streptomyces aurantiacus]|uniref:SAV_2336 N-terminal domain-related protein n=1 Tax=Streptomyces aurantiacus TaxID=47760 RepID=UPI00331CFF03
MPPSDASASGSTSGSAAGGRSGGPRGSLVDRLAAVLAAAGGAVGGSAVDAADPSAPSADELAELLWLARHMGPPPEQPSPSGGAVRGDAADASAPGDVPPPGPAPHDRPPDDPAPARRPAEPARVPLHLPSKPHARERASATPGGPGASGGTQLRVPVPPMIPHPLALQRALRPLGRRVPAPDRRVLDEGATAHRIAALGAHPRAWLPVLRPASERWLRLSLVYDDGPTMPVWRPLVRELHTAFAQSGLFRTVELHRAAPDGTVPPRAAEVPATGRTVTLVVSDCMGPQWHEGPAGRRWFRTLRRWADHLPLAVLQPLPERLWPTTAFPAAPGLLGAPHAAAPSAVLDFSPYDGFAPPAGTVPVPVLEVAPAWLSHWATLVADARAVPGSVARLGAAPAAADGESRREDVTLLPAEELVLRFRSTASPEAFRLAGHLALGEPHLPVMRLVHGAVSRRPRPQHLAEVVLSGMLSQVPGGTPGTYAFREGVREVLLGTLPRSARGRTRQLLARVGGLIDERAGVGHGVLRAVTGGGAAGAGAGAGAGEPFAEVSEESVRRLGGGGGLFAGRYRMLRRTGRLHEWLAEDSRSDDETVVVRTYPGAAPWPRVNFTGIARRLGLISHPGLAAITDHGIEDGIPYLVREFIDGRGLPALLRTSPHGLPAAQLTALIPGVAEALAALHDRGAAHGALHSWNVIVAPDGPVLTGIEAEEFNAARRSADLRALGDLVAAMYVGEGAGREHQPPLPLEGLDLPDWLRGELVAAIDELRFHDMHDQQRGLERLLRLPASAPRRRYELLGPVGVFEGDRPVVLRSPRQRAMLCVLLLHVGQPVSYDHLVAGVWGDAPPGDGARLVQTYASRLRTNLGPGSVEHRDGGYVLVAEPDDVDVARFRRLGDDAEEARAAGDFARARGLLRDALALWRGDPLQGVTGPVAEDARAGLLQLRVSMLRAHAALGLVLGEFEDTAAELRTVLQEFPDDEDFHRLLGEALRHQRGEDETPAAYPTLRAALGTEPSAELREVHRELEESQSTGASAHAPTPIAFAFTARPGWQADTLTKLSVAVSELLVRGGAGAEQFELLPRENGWDAAVGADVPMGPLLNQILRELPSLVWRFNGLGLVVAVDVQPPSALPRPDDHATVVLPRALHEALDDPGFQPLPGTDTWFCLLPAADPDGPLTATLAPADAVVLGFDGTLTRLYAPGKARDAALRLLSLVVRERDPEDALRGRPVGRAGGTSEFVHPLDVLRAFAQEGSLAAGLHDQLDRIERQAVYSARPTAHSNALVGMLRGRPRRRALAVVTDTAPRAVATYVATHGLDIPADRISCRTTDLSRLLPDPEPLRRVLERLDVPAGRCLMIGSAVAEATAARALGLPFIGYAPDDRARERLLAAGARHTVGSLAQIVDAVRGG